MKRGTPRLKKTYALAEALKIELPHAVGILVMLWEFCADQFPRGDIGTASDLEIAVAAGWKKRPLLLINALCDEKSRWLDRDTEHRLIVHDWPDHAEYEVCRKLIRLKKDFLPIYGKSVYDRKAPGEKARDSLGNGASNARTKGAPSQEALVSGSGEGLGSVGVDHHQQKPNSKNLLIVNFTGDGDGYASPEDELKARYQAHCGEPIKLALLDVIRSKLGGSITPQFVTELRGHTGTFKNFPGFLRDLAGKNSRPASRPVMAEENYKCPHCGSTKRGEGVRLVDGRAVPCECADRGYIARMEARGILKTEARGSVSGAGQ